jgi:hypothetical protein
MPKVRMTPTERAVMTLLRAGRLHRRRGGFKNDDCESEADSDESGSTGYDSESGSSEDDSGSDSSDSDDSGSTGLDSSDSESDSGSDHSSVSSSDETETRFDDAFRDDVEYITGGWRVSADDVRRKVDRLTKDARAMWVGIASSGDDGVRARWNGKYKALGMTSIAVVYSTDSDHFRREIERDLVDEFGDRCDNRTGGGGGGVGVPPYSVYVAWM